MYQEQLPHNPYAPPVDDPFAGLQQEAVAVEQYPASRGTRLLAAFVDGLLAGAAAIPGAILGFVLFESEFAMLTAYLGLIPFVIYQWYLVATTGQTLGKRWNDIKIVKVDGTNVNFVSGVLVRSWVPGFIGAIPIVGALFGLVNVLFIFGSEKRCLHDLIASTRVVNVLPTR